MALHVYKTNDELSLAAAEWVVEQINIKLQRQDGFTWLLSGGSTPKQLYHLLASERFQSKVNWSKLHIFFGDERFVPFDDERNNGKMAWDSLLSRVPVPQKQIHFINTQGGATESSQQYEQLLRQYFSNPSQTFDLALLGMGDDAHTLSLFPGSPLIKEKEKWVVSLYLPTQEMYRISLMPAIVNASVKTMFLVSGSSKAIALRNVINESYQPDKYPAQLIKPANHELHWFVDEAAAKYL